LLNQVTRQHLKLFKDSDRDHSQDGNASSGNDRRRTRRASETNLYCVMDSVVDPDGHDKPQTITERAPLSGRSRGTPLNNFEHRHKAQQRILEQQQQQLREQQKLIEEMRALQRQQMLQQQLAATQQRQAALAGPQHGGKTGVEPTHLQIHLANMQSELIDGDGGPTDAQDGQPVAMSR
jgi:TolA-binding protein